LAQGIKGLQFGRGLFESQSLSKLHRDRGCSEIKSLHYEPGFKPTRDLKRALTARVENLADFLEATQVDWSHSVA